MDDRIDQRQSGRPVERQSRERRDHGVRRRFGRLDMRQSRVHLSPRPLDLPGSLGTRNVTGAADALLRRSGDTCRFR